MADAAPLSYELARQEAGRRIAAWTHERRHEPGPRPPRASAVTLSEMIVPVAGGYAVLDFTDQQFLHLLDTTCVVATYDRAIPPYSEHDPDLISVAREAVTDAEYGNSDEGFGVSVEYLTDAILSSPPHRKHYLKRGALDSTVERMVAEGWITDNAANILRDLTKDRI